MIVATLMKINWMENIDSSFLLQGQAITSEHVAQFEPL